MGVLDLINIFDDDMEFYYTNLPDSIINPYTKTNLKIIIIHLIILSLTVLSEKPYNTNLMTIDIVSMLGFYYIFNRLVPDIRTGKKEIYYPLRENRSNSMLMSLYIILAETAFFRFGVYLLFGREFMTLQLNPKLIILMLLYTAHVIRSTFYKHKGISSRDYNAAIRYIIAESRGEKDAKAASLEVFSEINNHYVREYYKKEKERSLEQLKNNSLLMETVVEPISFKYKEKESQRLKEEELTENAKLLRRREREMSTTHLL